MLAIVAIGVIAVTTIGREDTTLAASADESPSTVDAAQPASEQQVAQTEAEVPEPGVEVPEAGPEVEVVEEEVTILTEDDRSPGLRSATGGWATNWNRRTIEYDELLSGGPPRDGIPSIDNPQFVKAGRWMADLLGARYVLMEGAAHLPNMERPEVFNELVFEFLAEVG